MLLNEFLKEHRPVAEQQSAINELKATVRETTGCFCLENCAATEAD